MVIEVPIFDQVVRVRGIPVDGDVPIWNAAKRIYEPGEAGGAGGGDDVLVNSSGVTGANLNNTTPAAPAGDLNVKWATTGSGPASISAYVDASVLEPLLSLPNLAGTLTQGQIPATLDANARVGVRKNSTGSTFTRRRLNVIEGANIALTVADDVGSEEVDVTVAVTGIAVPPFSVADLVVANVPALIGRVQIDLETAEEIVLDGTLVSVEADPSTIGRAAITGDVTIGVSSNSATIAAGVVTNAKLATEAKKTAIQLVIGDGINTITTGLKGYIQVPFHATITAWHLVADASGNIAIDVWRDSYANFPPVEADSIVGSEPPTLSGTQKNQDLALSTWTTDLDAETWLAFNVDSATTVKQVTLVLSVTRHDG